jgi:hypothetical protein
MRLKILGDTMQRQARKATHDNAHAGRQMKLRFRIAICLVGLVVASAGARSPKAKLHAPYPDSAKGLAQELYDMRDVARKGKGGLDQLRAMVVDLEIPNARSWYLTNFGTDGSQLADYYQKNFTKSEQQLEDQMTQFARQEGGFSVKKQDPKKAYSNIVTAPEVFLASYETSSRDEQEDFSSPIGYFLFIDGKFRWDSTIQWITLD